MLWLITLLAGFLLFVASFALKCRSQCRVVGVWTCSCDKNVRGHVFVKRSWSPCDGPGMCMYVCTDVCMFFPFFFLFGVASCSGCGGGLPVFEMYGTVGCGIQHSLIV